MSRSGRGSRRPGRLATFALALAIALALTVVACGRSRPSQRADIPKAFPKAPVVLISIDTLRSDRLPFYGYKGVETPALTSFRADAILFEKAYSHVPLTLPSHASMFTGLLPAEHGIRDNLGYTLKRVPTLAELLKSDGYATGAAVGSIVLNGAAGLARGFDLYDDSIEARDASQLGQGPASLQRDGGRSAAILRHWLSANSAGPFLAFLHLYEPHTPYEPPEPYRSRYPNTYDGEIAASDAIVGDFLDFLKARKLYDASLIVILSDHGEGLGDHGEDEHGVFLYREALQVPLLVKLPRQALAGAQVASPVQLCDVYDTIAKAVAVPSFTPHPGNLSLIELASGEAPAERRLFAETLYPRLHFGWSELRSLIDDRWQYIEAPAAEFFDLKNDRSQRENLAPKKPQAFRSMKVELERRATPFEAPGAVDPEQAKKLASLGYLSAGARPSGGPLKDPKDEIHVIRRMREAVTLFQQGRAPEAVALYKSLLAENPRLLDLWDLYSQALLAQGRPMEALQALKKGIENSGGESTHFIVAAGNLALRLGRLEDAKKHAEIGRDRGDPGAEDLLSRIHLANLDYKAAEAAAMASLRLRPNRRMPYLILGRIESQRGNLKKALEYSDKVQALDKEGGHLPQAGSHFLRGDILAKMGQAAEAEKEFQEEIRLFPQGLEARQGLALLYLSQNRREEGKAALERMLAEVPAPQAYEMAIETARQLGDRKTAEAWTARARERFGK